MILKSHFRFTQLYPLATISSASAIYLAFKLFRYYTVFRKRQGLTLASVPTAIATATTDPERRPLISTNTNAETVSYTATPDVNIPIASAPELDFAPDDFLFEEDTVQVGKVFQTFGPNGTFIASAKSANSTYSDSIESSDATSIISESSTASLDSQEAEDESNKKDYAVLSASSSANVTLFTVLRSTPDRIRLTIELIGTTLLVALSAASFFIPAVRNEWTSKTPGPSPSSGVAYRKYYGGGYAPMIAITAFWFYALTLVVARISLIKASVTPVVPLWAHSSTLYLVAFISYLVTFRSTILYPYSSQSRFFNIVESVLSLVLFVNNFSAKIGDKPGRLYVKGDIFPSIEPISSIFSLITYSWIDSTIWTGYFRSLTAKDIWELRIDDHASFVLTAFRSLKAKPETRLTVRLLKFFTWPLIISNSWTFIYSLLSFGPPFLLKAILEYVENPAGTPRSLVWLYVFAFLFCGILTNIVQGQSLFIGRRICIRLRSILIGEIYAKTLRRRATTGNKNETDGDENEEGKKDGKKDKKDKKKDKKEDNEKDEKDEDGQANHGAIINLMAVDTFKVSEICAYLHFVTLAVFVTFLCIFFLYMLIGWSSFVGAGSMMILMPLQYYLSSIYSKYQEKLMAATDSRINKLNEILQSIRIIKYFAWEKKFAESVLKIREEELTQLRNKFICWTYATLVYFMIPIVVTVFTFSTYIFVQKELLTAPIAFTVLSLLNVMRGPLDQLSEMITEFLQAKVSVDRIDKFLNERETSKYTQLSHPNVRASAAPRIGIEDATFSWESSDASNTSKTDFKLRDINVDFNLGALNVVVGPTGSGKTSLLLALLGEMELVKGSVYLPGAHLRDEVVPNPATGLAETVAYCSQTPWLLNETLRNNILFGSEYDKERYNAVIEACSLKRDLDILDAGDQTEIGEKGITLSGGQKQRVSLARAFYSNSRHLILDDCLSAVDSHTAKWIYEHCLVGPISLGRTIILVSHNVTLTVSQASMIVVMDNGRIKAQGEPGTLIAQGHLGDDELLTSASVTRAASSVNLSSQGQTSQSGRIPPQREIGMSIGEEVAAKLNEELDSDIIEEEHEEANAERKKKKEKRKRGDGKLISEETKSEGHVSANVYIAYLKAIGGAKFWTLMTILFVSQPVFDIGLSYWIKVWTSAVIRQDSTTNDITILSNYHIKSNGIVLDRAIIPSILSLGYSYLFHTSLDYLKNSDLSISSTLNAWDEETKSSAYYMIMYILIGIAFSTFTALNVLFNFLGGINASRKIFNDLLTSVLDSKIRFFDSTPIGRIMNRFSKDIEGVDQDLSIMASHVIRCTLGALSVTILIAAITPGFLIFAVFIIALYYAIGIFYLSASRELKRLDSISKSPIYQHFGETLSGVSTIRAYGVGNRFISDNLNKVDNNNRPFFYLWVANRWLSFRVDLAGALVSFAAAAMIILDSSRIDAGLAGLSLSYALTFNEYVLWIVRLYAVMEMNMNSVERLLEYMNLDKEAAAVIPDSRPPSDWPSRGEIEVNDLSLRYAPELPLVIKNVSFKVPSFSKIGIVGRTGAGKSTIITAFFRFLEADTGFIKIDGLDISKIGLRDLRQNLAIIPQDPTLFQGTIRSNLDPFEQYSDKEIFEALRRVHLIKPNELPDILRADKGKGQPARSNSPKRLSDAATTAEDSVASSLIETAASAAADASIAADENVNVFLDLSTNVAEGGSNLSQGQRQLMCLARSLLKSPKVLLLDEATASIDYESDAQIQKTIREEFSQTTILTIAHRLRSIADYDKILVMDAGMAVEYDHPHMLLQNKESVFYSMCANSGELEALIGIALDAYKLKK